MPTTADLGALLKKKYPGAYDSFDDDALGQKLQAKYPGAYDQFTPAELTPDETPASRPDLFTPAPPIMQASHAPTMAPTGWATPPGPDDTLPQGPLLADTPRARATRFMAGETPLYAGKPLGYEPQTQAPPNPLLTAAGDALQATNEKVTGDLESVLAPVREGIGAATEDIMRHTPLGASTPLRVVNEAYSDALQGLLAPENAKIAAGLAAGGGLAPAYAEPIAQGAAALFAGQGAKQLGEQGPAAVSALLNGAPEEREQAARALLGLAGQVALPAAHAVVDRAGEIRSRFARPEEPPPAPEPGTRAAQEPVEAGATAAPEPGIPGAAPPPEPGFADISYTAEPQPRAPLPKREPVQVEDTRAAQTVADVLDRFAEEPHPAATPDDIDTFIKSAADSDSVIVERSPDGTVQVHAPDAASPVAAGWRDEVAQAPERENVDRGPEVVAGPAVRGDERAALGENVEPEDRAAAVPPAGDRAEPDQAAALGAEGAVPGGEREGAEVGRLRFEVKRGGDVLPSDEEIMANPEAYPLDTLKRFLRRNDPNGEWFDTVTNPREETARREVEEAYRYADQVAEASGGTWGQESYKRADELANEFEDKFGKSFEERPDTSNEPTHDDAVAAIRQMAEDSKPASPRLRIVAAPEEEPGKSLGAAAGADLDQPGIAERFRRFAASALSEPLQERLSRFNQRRKDISERNLQSIEALAPKAAERFAYASSAEPQARELVHSMESDINDIYGRKTGFSEFASVQIDSALQGARERYEHYVDQIRHTAPDELLDAYRGEYRTAVEAVDRMGVKDFAKNADEAAQSGDGAGLAQILEDGFQEAAGKIGRAYFPEGANETPEYKAAKQLYKERYEGPIRNLHAEAGGHELTFLGPEDTYFPLLAERAPADRGVFNRVTFKKPEAARSNFRTGMAENYSTAAKSLLPATIEIVRKDNLNAGFRALEDAGVMQRLKQGEPGGNTFLLNGVEEPAKVVEVGVPTIVLKDGKKIFNPAPRAVMPERVYRELKPVLDANKETEGFFQKINNTITSANLGGVTDLAYHNANIAAAMFRRSPAIAYALAKKGVMDARTSGRFADFFKAFSSDPFAPENREAFRNVLKGGAISTRYGRVSYTEKGAGLLAGKTLMEEIKEHPISGPLHAAGPLLSGPKGTDIRARILWEKALEVIEPKSTWAERQKWSSELGNYNRALQSEIARKAKDLGVSPFVVAGRTFNKLGVESWNPVPSLPGKMTLEKGAIQASQALTSAWGLLGLWWLVHKELTGQTPSEAKSRLFEIPADRIDAGIRNSAFGRMLGLGEKGAALSMNLYSLPARGARMFGAQAAYNDIQRGEKRPSVIFDDALREAINTRLHPFEGPPARMLTRALMGADPYIVKDYRTGDWGLKSVIPKGTPPESRFKERVKSVTTGLNPMAEQFGSEGKTVGEVARDTIMPRLVKKPFKKSRFKR